MIVKRPRRVNRLLLLCAGLVGIALLAGGCNEDKSIVEPGPPALDDEPLIPDDVVTTYLEAFNTQDFDPTILKK